MHDPSATTPQGPISGFWSSVTDVLALFVDIVETRMELLFLDLQEGTERLVGLLAWGLIGLLAAVMSLLLGAFTLILAFWDTHRILVAGLITALFAALALLALVMVGRHVRARQALFAATMEEFAKDRQHLRSEREASP